MDDEVEFILFTFLQVSISWLFRDSQTFLFFIFRGSNESNDALRQSIENDVIYRSIRAPLLMLL